MSQLITVEAHSTGAVFDNTATQIIDGWLHETVDHVADRGWDVIQYWMNVYFKTQTPYYRTRVVVDRTTDDRVIHDNGVVYGPWLDGSSSRNTTTRFKGYPHWRKTVQYIEQELSPAILERELDRLERRLNQ